MNGRLGRTLRTAAAVLPIVGFMAMTQASAALHGDNRPVVARPAPPAIRGTDVRPKLGAGLTYTIADDGAPPTKTYSSARPVAFNNSGQILGVGDPIKKAGYADCLLNTAVGKFLDLTPSTTDFSCAPFSISSVDPTGVARVVGQLDTPYQQNPVAFAATFTVATGKGAVSAFTSNVPSALYSVNLSGEAVGDADYTPQGGFYTTQPLFVLPAASTKLVVAQPQCTVYAQYCGELAEQGVCVFGGCNINDAGIILAYDYFSGYYMTYVYGQPTSAIDLPLSASNQAYALNNAGQILYYPPGETQTLTAIYSIPAGTTTTIPALDGDTCNGYYPLSISNTGQVFGYYSGCTSGYWTWDSVNGTQDIATELPKNSYTEIYPLAVNDNGQILVTLYPAKGGVHWGTLNPPAAATVKPRAIRAHS